MAGQRRARLPAEPLCDGRLGAGAGQGWCKAGRGRRGGGWVLVTQGRVTVAVVCTSKQTFPLDLRIFCPLL